MDLILSASSVSAYLRCHYAWYRGYVLRLPGTQSMAAAIGQALHAGVEAMLKEENQWLVSKQDVLTPITLTPVEPSEIGRSRSPQSGAENTTDFVCLDTMATSGSARDTGSSESTESVSSSTGSSWSKNSDARSGEENQSTTRTESNSTTGQRIWNSGLASSDTDNEHLNSSVPIAGDRTQIAIEAAQRAFAHEVARVPTPEVEADPGAWQDAERMLEVYRREVMPTFTPTMVEQPFSMRVAGVTVTGTIDAADEGVRDLKSTAGKTINGKPPRFDPERYDFQLGIYDMGYEVLTGNRPAYLALDVVTRRGTYRQYRRAPERGEVVDVLGIVAAGIARGDYEPTGLYNGACSFCPYTAKGCRYVEAK